MPFEQISLMRSSPDYFAEGILPGYFAVPKPPHVTILRQRQGCNAGQFYLKPKIDKTYCQLP